MISRRWNGASGEPVNGSIGMHSLNKGVSILKGCIAASLLLHKKIRMISNYFIFTL
jgi:hypothetical protein